MNLRKLLREKKRQRAEMMKNTYVIQPKNKPQYYKTKIKRGRKVDLGNFKTQRHANSTEVVGRNTDKFSKKILKSYDSSDRGDTPNSKAVRMKNKVRNWTFKRLLNFYRF